MLQPILLFMTAGACVGLLAGLLGIGGGIVAVPVLMFYLRETPLPADILMHVSVATSLAVVCFTALFACIRHFLQQNVALGLACYLGFGLFVGALLGPILAQHTSRVVLQQYFILLLVLMIIWHVADLGRVLAKRSRDWQNATWRTSGFAVFVGTVASMLGIGGGLFIFPYLARFRLRVAQIAGTTALCSFLSSLVGCLAFASSPLPPAANTMPNLWGYVYLPAVVGMAPASVLFANIGVWLSHRISLAMVRRLFLLLLFALLVRMLLFI